MYKKKGYHIGRCKRCGLVQVLDEIDDRTLPELYGRSYYEGENEFVYADYLAKSEQKSRDYEWRLATICRRNNISESGTCLEIGCAFGLFLDVARRHGWKTKGFELSAHSARYARERLGLDVSDEPHALEKVESASHDLVVMWDVIEHLSSPLEVLKQLRRILKPGGVLALSTGDIGCFGARLYGKRWHLLMPPYHLFYFDRASIQKMLEAAGFTLRDVQSHGHPLDNHGKPRLLAWIAAHDKHIGWRFDSGPIIMVTAHAMECPPESSVQDAETTHGLATVR
jgi:2-polyprenyl-3-methyl-5-hydroxy-6-metoxy-1,4-benzoquinol methylase